MKKKELIELYYDVGDAAEARRGLGGFDTNSPHILLLLEGLQRLIQHTIEKTPDDPKRGKKK